MCINYIYISDNENTNLRKIILNKNLAFQMEITIKVLR